MINQKSIDLIKSFEGLRLAPYQDSVGVWTIGYGTTHGINAKTKPITQKQAESMLMRDVATFERTVRRAVKVPCNENQIGALVSFTYNLGPGAFLSSTLLKRVNAMEWDDVPNQFLRWVYAGKKILRGLERRREAEALLWSEY